MLHPSLHTISNSESYTHSLPTKNKQTTKSLIGQLKIFYALRLNIIFLAIQLTKVKESMTIATIWNDKLNDKNSTEYQKLKEEVERAVS